jgi:chaperone required for assembly of F1-ATPase
VVCCGVEGSGGQGYKPRPYGQHGVLLDDRTLKTPAKADFCLPNRALAEAVAAEWDAQQTEICPLQMPLTRLIATAIDRTAADRAAVTAEIVRYSDTDLLSHRAEQPPELAARQTATWQPLLDWFRDRYDIQFHVTCGVVAVPQSPELKPRLEQICTGLDPLKLTILHALTSATGSVVIGLAMLEGGMDAEAAYRASLLDELFQAELWGEDSEAAARRSALLADLASVKDCLTLLQEQA